MFYRPGSIIVDLILTTKGIFPQELYDTLKFSIESGQLGNLQVALVPGMSTLLYFSFVVRAE